ncbi:hypothetical protein [Xenorhabdus bovienii]|nr:hypothetical protein [Xenorhabdus bovienii]MDE9464349.1 hypothetical protein [Xenorhabdus bovienii]
MANSIAGNDTLAGREPLLVDGGDVWQEERYMGSGLSQDMHLTIYFRNT